MPKNAKYGGRKLGTPNKITHEIKSILSDYCLTEVEYLLSHIETLSLEKRAAILLKILPLITPKDDVLTVHRSERVVPTIIFSDGAGSLEK